MRARRPLGASGERGEDGAAWLPASVCCAVSLRLSSPTGAILGSFQPPPRGALPSRPGRAVCVSRKRFLSRALKASTRNNSLPFSPLHPRFASLFAVRFFLCVCSGGERRRVLGCGLFWDGSVREGARHPESLPSPIASVLRVLVL